jgi:hypothetical protein
MWAEFSSFPCDGLVPDCIYSIVVGAYSDLGQRNALENGTNPVKKEPLAVDGNDLEVIIDEIIGGDGAKKKWMEKGMKMSLYMSSGGMYAFLPSFAS